MPASPASSATASSSIRRRCSRIDELTRNGIDVESRIRHQRQGALILPYHRDLDLLSEARRGERKIGTTSRGIGRRTKTRSRAAASASATCRSRRARAERPRQRHARNRLVQDSTMDWKPVLAQLLQHAERMRPMIRDVSLLLTEAMRAGKSILFEGAQGTLLDIDHGTYPYVTSSNASIGGVCTGLGVRRRRSARARRGQGVHDARRRGPLPTELSGEMGNRLRESGNEYGAVTGRPRRCGWYDAVAVRYASASTASTASRSPSSTSSTASSASTSAPRIAAATDADRVSVRHRAAGAVRAGLRIDAGLDGADGRRARRSIELPEAARNYIARLEEVSGVRAAIVSTGSERDDTICGRRNADCGLRGCARPEDVNRRSGDQEVFF
jgi:adenylosuccinate synthase